MIFFILFFIMEYNGFLNSIYLEAKFSTAKRIVVKNLVFLQ